MGKRSVSTVSVKDSQILRECPFCGGEASKRLFYKGKYRVHCNVCDAHSGDVVDTEAEAIAAWNTRTDDYERAAEYWQRMYEQTFVERTCHDTGENEWHFVCSACGYEQNGYECWNYCPNCGSRVIA